MLSPWQNLPRRLTTTATLQDRQGHTRNTSFVQPPAWSASQWFFAQAFCEDLRALGWKFNTSCGISLSTSWGRHRCISVRVASFLGASAAPHQSLARGFGLGIPCELVPPLRGHLSCPEFERPTCELNPANSSNDPGQCRLLFSPAHPFRCFRRVWVCATTSWAPIQRVSMLGLLLLRLLRSSPCTAPSERWRNSGANRPLRKWGQDRNVGTRTANQSSNSISSSISQLSGKRAAPRHTRGFGCARGLSTFSAGRDCAMVSRPVCNTRAMYAASSNVHSPIKRRTFCQNEFLCTGGEMVPWCWAWKTLTAQPCGQILPCLDAPRTHRVLECQPSCTDRH